MKDDFPFQKELQERLAAGTARRGMDIEKVPVKGWAVICPHIGTTLVESEDERALDAAIDQVRVNSPSPQMVHWSKCWVHFQERWGPFVVDRKHHKPRAE